MSDREDRALIYGRGSSGWIAAERTAGRDAVVATLREMLVDGRAADRAAVLEAASRVAPRVAVALREWWTQYDFDPVLPPEGPDEGEITENVTTDHDPSIPASG